MGRAAIFLMPLFFPKNNMLEDFKRELVEQGTVSLKVKVHAGAHQSKIKSVLSDGTIKVDITKAPEAGKANQELYRLLAQEFAVKESAIEVVLGKFSSDKIVRITE